MRAAPLATAVLALGLTAATAPAAILLVPQNHATIQDAVDQASSGDEIRVAEGTYAPFAVIAKSFLTITGTPDTIVDGANLAAIVVEIRDSSSITLERLTVRFAVARAIDVENSDAITIRRCAVTDAYDALRVHGSGFVLIEKTRFATIGNDAIDFSDDDIAGPGHDSEIRKNSFLDVGAEAIEIEGDNNVVEKNRIETTGGSAISLEDSALHTLVKKNRIAGTVGDALTITGSGHTIEKNRIDEAGDDGIVMEGSSTVVRKNRVTNAADNGIEVGIDDGPLATSNLFLRNTVQKARRTAYVVADGGNTFKKNKATGSGVSDLVDTAGDGANSYVKNNFTAAAE
jgi:hypothetical protein